MTHVISPREREIYGELGTLAEFYPNANVSTATFWGYARELADLDVGPELLRAAIALHVRTSRYFPTLDELLESCSSLVPDGHRDPDTIWEEIGRQMTLGGRYHRPEFSDPLILKAIDSAMGSWSELCDASREHRASNRARIIAAYRTLVKRARWQGLMTPRIRQLVDRVTRAVVPPASAPLTDGPEKQRQLAELERLEAIGFEDMG